MKYFLIAGEASGDLHASHLMQALKEHDADARFRCIGGDLMEQAGGKLVKHYKQLAYMGFIPVLLHLPEILRGMKECKREISSWQPDVVILIDYPGFNLQMAKYVHEVCHIPVFYYISPKIWAWKEYRIKDFKRHVDRLFSILPFEVDFFEGKHAYPISYVGNPTVDEVAAFKAQYAENYEAFCARHGLDAGKQIIALLAGSRMQEIRDNLTRMVEAASPCAATSYQLVLAGAPSMTQEVYDAALAPLRRKGVDVEVKIIFGETYPLLSHATAALVTSGTATLETALFGVPQVVCYYTVCGKLISWLRKHILSVKYISLVNLVAASEVVPELVADGMTVANVKTHLADILPGGSARAAQLSGYAEMTRRLGQPGAPKRAAEEMVGRLKER